MKDKTNDGNTRRIDRRTVLEKGALAVGGLSVAGTGIAAADNKPRTFSYKIPRICRPIPCRDEEICIEQGVVRNRVHVTEDGSGGFHLTFHSHWDPLAVAVGEESGIEWSGQGIRAQAEYQASGPFPQTIQFIDKSTLTSEGPVDDLHVFVNFHVTVNAEGEITAFRPFEIEITCRG
ncbi:MAG: hypothetical protein ABEH66_07300 [Halobacteriales archaeon]